MNAENYEKWCIVLLELRRICESCPARRSAAGTFERADLSPAPDVTKRYYTPPVGTCVKSEVNARKFCSASPEHVRQHHRIRRRAREAGAGAHKNYVSSYGRASQRW